MSAKFVETISAQEVEKLLDGNLEWMTETQANSGETLDRPLVLELCHKMRFQRLIPRTIVDYQREAYVFEAGNVRVTFDSDLRIGISPDDFLQDVENYRTVPAGNPPLIMEVKWDTFLPSIIQDAIRPRSTSSS